MTTEKWRPRDKSDLMDAITREWNLLMEAVAKLDSKQMTAPDAEGWTPKDNLAHLAEWMKILMGFYMDLRRAHEVLGVAEEVTQVWDFQARNHLLFERNRHRPLEEVLNEIRQVYTELTTRLNGMSFDELMKPQHPFDSSKRPLLDFVLRGTVEHFAEHRRRMEEDL